MPAKSEKQRKLFGLALSVKRGITSRSQVSNDVLKIVDNMSEDQIKDFAIKEEMNKVLERIYGYTKNFDEII